MYKSAGYLISLLIFLTSSLSAQSVKSLEKLFDKKDFEKVRKKLEKAVEKEGESISSTYLYALYFSDTTNTIAYHLDSAYQSIVKSEELYSEADENTITLLKDEGLDINGINQQRNKIEDTVFGLAEKEPSEIGFQNFITIYPDTKYQQRAIELRDSLAYIKALNTHTYQSYFNFLQKYPEALQVREAKTKYETLVYETLTASNKKDDLASFIKSYADNPYIPVAEKRLFDLLTYDHKEASYKEFVREFPKNAFAERAWNCLWYKAEDKNTFFKFYPDAPPVFKQLSALVPLKYYPYFSPEHNKFGFFDYQGNMQIQANITDIPEDYLCEGVEGDYIVVGKDKAFGTVDKMGEQRLPNQFDNIEPFSPDILKIQKNNLWGLYHKSGFPMISTEYDDIGTLTESLIRIRKGDKWGIITPYGKVLLDTKYEEIRKVEERLIILKQGSLYAIVKEYDILKEGSPNITFQYDECEHIKNGFLKLKKDNEFTIINTIGETVIQESEQIWDTEEGWLVYRDGQVTVMDHFGKKIHPSTFDHVNEGQSCYIVQKDNKWGAMDFDGGLFINMEYDTISFMGTKALLLSQEKKMYGYFGGKQLVPISKFPQVTVQKASVEENDLVKDVLFMVAKQRNKKWSLHTKEGEMILPARYDEITILNQRLAKVKSGKRTGLFDLKGNRILPIQFDGIAKASRSYTFSLFKNRKFGLFDYRHNFMIPAEYDGLLKPYGQSDSIFIAKKDTYGLINKNNQVVSDFQFEELQYWNDSIALVKEKDKWKLYHTRKHYFLPEVFDSYRTVKDTEEEKTIITYRSTGYGVLSNKRGRIIVEEFSDIINLGDTKNPLYFVERSISQVGLYVILYFDGDGKLIKENILREKAYQRIICPD